LRERSHQVEEIQDVLTDVMFINAVASSSPAAWKNSSPAMWN